MGLFWVSLEEFIKVKWWDSGGTALFLNKKIRLGAKMPKSKGLIKNVVKNEDTQSKKRNRKLTRRQEKFVRELVSCDGLITMREAAVRAGYPISSAHARAHELTSPRHCPHVVAEIARYRESLDEMYNVGYKRHIRDLQKIRDLALANGAYSAAVGCGSTVWH